MKDKFRGQLAERRGFERIDPPEGFSENRKEGLQEIHLRR